MSSHELAEENKTYLGDLCVKAVEKDLQYRQFDVGKRRDSYGI